MLKMFVALAILLGLVTTSGCTKQDSEFFSSIQNPGIFCSELKKSEEGPNVVTYASAQRKGQTRCLVTVLSGPEQSDTYRALIQKRAPFEDKTEGGYDILTGGTGSGTNPFFVACAFVPEGHDEITILVIGEGPSKESAQETFWGLFEQFKASYPKVVSTN